MLHRENLLLSFSALFSGNSQFGTGFWKPSVDLRIGKDRGFVYASLERLFW